MNASDKLWTSLKRTSILSFSEVQQMHAHHFRYLTSYPYLLSGALHTYAGLLSFHLAQPPSALASNAPATKPTFDENADNDVEPQLDTASLHSEDSARQSKRSRATEPPNPTLIRQARAYFIKAVNLDTTDQVAKEFIELVSHLRYMTSLVLT
jgi:hypothetical protein